MPDPQVLEELPRSREYEHDNGGGQLLPGSAKPLLRIRGSLGSSGRFHSNCKLAFKLLGATPAHN
jgi:hypothetical protein